MKLARLMKIVGLSVVALAVLTFSAPGYAWTHDDGFGRNHYSGYRHNHHSGYYGYRHHGGWGNGYSGSYYAPRYYAPRVSPGFGIYLPGFSFYVGP